MMVRGMTQSLVNLRIGCEHTTQSQFNPLQIRNSKTLRYTITMVARHMAWLLVDPL